MIRAIMHGCNGKMGQVITGICKEDTGIEIVAGIDVYDGIANDYPVFPNISVCDVQADVIIDFSNPELLEPLLTFATYKKMPIVICTTGFSEEQVDKIKAASKLIPIFFSGNMSIGINLLIELAKKVTLALGANFDVEIIEKHHNQKVDAPSGTAFMIADAIASTNVKNYAYTYDRHAHRHARRDNEIGIHSIRGGTIVGEHEVSFAGKDEVLTISHSAQSKEIFAVGAVNAAKFIISQPAGLYGMADLLK